MVCHAGLGDANQFDLVGPRRHGDRLQYLSRHKPRRRELLLPLNGGTLVTTTTYNDTTAAAGTTYYYTVRGGERRGQQPSLQRSQPCDYPAVPTGLVATPVSGTQINLSWTCPGGTVQRLQRLSRHDRRRRELLLAINGSTLVTDHRLQRHDGHRRHDVLLHRRGGERRGQQRGLQRSQRPDVPGGTRRACSPRPASTTQINFSWTASGGTVNGYNVYRGTTPGGESSSPLNGGTLVTTTAYSDTTAAAGTTYYYTVKAVNASGSARPPTRPMP